MAADQKRKRMTGNTILGGTSWEQYRAKKNLGTPQSDMKFNTRIHLKWDGDRKQVVARRNQVGMTRRYFREFVDSMPQGNSYLVDVVSVPQEIFDLKNITEVLSYDVWKTHLSEYERNQLMQFLPKESDVEEVVQELLDGNNIHFGNPLLKWGSSLCSGNLHPDAVICHERCLKSDKKAYFSDLQKYHNDMIDYLVNLKEKCGSCKDPEREILEIWRSRNKAEDKLPSHVNNSGSHEFDVNGERPSDSYSLLGNEKGSSSDNQKSSVLKAGKSQKRIHKKVVPMDSHIKSVVGSADVLNAGARSKMGDTLQKRNIQCIDGSNYMSILKVSKKQFELIKNMKQSGKSILSRSLNRLIGDIGTSQVQSYESFVEEEQKKLHEHWLHLVKDELPSAYADWRDKQVQVEQVILLLHQELKTKVDLYNEEGKGPGNCLPEQKRESTGALENINDSSASLEQNQISEVSLQTKTISLQSHPEGNSEEVVQGLHWNQFIQEEEELGDEGNGEEEDECNEEQRDELNAPLQNLCEDPVEVLPGCTPDQLRQKSLVLKDGHNATETVSNQFSLRPVNASQEFSDFSGNLNMQVFADKQGVPLSAGEDSWLSVSMQQSYYESTASRGYASSGLSAVHLKVNEEPQSHFMNLGSNFHDGDSVKYIFQKQPGTASVSYPNQFRNDLLSTSFNGPEMISNHIGQRQADLHFQGQNNVLIEHSHSTGHYQQQAQLTVPLEQYQRRQSEAYMQRSMSENIYTDGFGFSTSSQEHLPSVNLQDWPVNPSLKPAALTGGELLNQTWFSNEHQARSSWIGSGASVVPSQTHGNGSMDQSLFSVLSHCNHPQSVPSYDPMQSMEQLTPSTSYGIGSGITTRIGNVLPQGVPSRDFLTGREGATSDG